MHSLAPQALHGEQRSAGMAGWAPGYVKHPMAAERDLAASHPEQALHCMRADGLLLAALAQQLLDGRPLQHAGAADPAAALAGRKLPRS